MDFRSGDIERITRGTLYGPSDLVVKALLTDSRQASYSEDAAFVAIKGVNHDGHSFIDAMFRKGVRVFLVESLPSKMDLYFDAAFILVPATVNALQLLAAEKRRSFRSVVVAVTGSAGKTIVKEWLADILSHTGPVVRSPRSYNSQIGVPLSVWKLDDKFSYGVFEAGISLPGEMDRLRNVIEPDLGIITNIGDAHRENFSSDEEKASEKLRLFTKASTIVYCSDNLLPGRLIKKDPVLGRKRLVDWSLTNSEAVVYASRISSDANTTLLGITFKGKTGNYTVPFTDRASVENCITVASACLAMGIDPSIIASGLSGLSSVAMRMEIKNGINNCQLIEDYYNSDPGSLVMAIDYLRSQLNRKTTLILSDFMQSGRDEKELYSEVAALVRSAGIDQFVGIGGALVRNSSFFDEEAEFYYSTDDFIRNFDSRDFFNEVILLKGARTFELEKIARLLEQQAHITVLEINLDAISHNLNEFRKHLDPGTRIMVMVKAFAYGAGPSEIAGLLEYHRISYLGVANTDEGVELRKAGVTMPVMVMNPDLSTPGIMIQNNLEPEVYSFSSLARFTEAALRYGLDNYPVHLKIDTGMHRLGFMPEDIDELARRLKDLSCIRVMSVFSHLSASDDPVFDSFTHQQAGIFNTATEKIKQATGYTFLRHILNTAGILRFPEYQFEMVRPGIGIYGAGELGGDSLRHVSTFKTRISQVKRIPAGDPVGYGCSDVSERDRVIAILPVGYADGLSRKLGNGKGYLFIKGKKVPLVGNICMDTCMADVTSLNPEEGDEAEIFGSNITINEFASLCDTIPYEVLTSIPARVKRIFYRE
ncbi:MAG: bifunctional UDP-N-acetylmuramoyl-tripeptide:D-alanyl-D-alanine ligase/alanine racemase [Bacteroidales bacterium]|jgi:alanine racemase|nr:bifunctional UDP-N-acetylmuramoyl-tripeptide:D-alanyl-D-alanine ligase/alanine racemase [Bacteroidales bacterium]